MKPDAEATADAGDAKENYLNISADEWQKALAETAEQIVADFELGDYMEKHKELKDVTDSDSLAVWINCLAEDTNQKTLLQLCKTNEVSGSGGKRDMLMRLVKYTVGL
jgi:hypothetical protein